MMREAAKSIHFFFFFQAEDGIRDLTVTGVQTCALPISRCRDGDLECPALNNRGIVEIAKSGNVNDVAEHAAASRFGEDALVKFRGRSGRDNQKHSIEIAGFECALAPFDGAQLGPGANLRGRFGRHYAHVTAGLQEAGDFGLSNSACSDHEAVPGRKSKEHGEELFRFHSNGRTRSSQKFAPQTLSESSLSLYLCRARSAGNL